MAVSSSFNLPRDVVYQILLWLPVVSLLRFKSVCKAWRSLIESSDFVAQHLKGVENFIVKDLSQNWVSSPYFSFSSLSGKNYEVSEDLKLPHIGHVLQMAKIIGSCNGIICVRYHPDIFLWNPATKQSRVVPKSLTSLSGNSKSVTSFEFGFGFDPKTQDYKLVKIFIESGWQFKSLIKNQVEVYNLSNDTWRSIDAELPVNIINFDPKSPFRDGIYCWLGKVYVVENGSEIFHPMIVSFDFTNEVFETMAVPDVFSNNHESNLTINFYKEKIACLDWVHPSWELENWHCTIWVLNEYGVKESWTKLYTIVLESFFWFSWILGNGNILLLKRAGMEGNESKMLVYDPVTQKFNNLPFQGAGSHFDLKLCVYKESLVSVKSTKSHD